MPTLTNNGFVIGDLNVLTGLLGDTSSTLNTNWSPSSNASDDLSFSVYCTGTPNTGYVIGAGEFTAASNIQNDGYSRNNCQTGNSGRVAVSTGNMSGTTRSASTGFDWVSGGSSGSFTQTAATPTASNFSIFSRTGNEVDTVVGPTNASIATYHAGAALNLATLESLQATLISEIAAI
jgi:hypothetical protein